MAMATVRAMAVPTLLYSCFSSVWAKTVKVSPAEAVQKVWLKVEVACEPIEGKLHGRFLEMNNWERSVKANDTSDDDVWLYSCLDCTDAYAAADKSNAVGFRMEVTTYGESQVYKKWVEANTTGVSSSVASIVCEFTAMNDTKAGCTVLGADPVTPPEPKADSLTERSGRHQPEGAVGFKGAPLMTNGGDVKSKKSAKERQSHMQRSSEGCAKGAEYGKESSCSLEACGH
ncbi:hypothetical protein TraAM80_09127 [Trypanosoma rangeli]|uniref:Mucin-like glycoprotein n=1 Tax=Trypanosoma rangeli TaxID=5698 RepID=A0A3R7R8T5_TRYRA|nr:uncharacterized protein TraAM80_09127 [Trypanosoma rangeli]RNE97942.1 hypothetical protein TraAM80_09127 [Trypanosoma rangeli]|eukprot:RNE97942.1 hypothetical protein TraAM80_09127 [Trypanosoma rangeli]